MWKLNDKTDGLVTWESETGAWSFDARGEGYGFTVSDGSSNSECLVKVAATDDGQFPSLGEQFVRSDELHLSYPQGDHLFGVRLALQPIDSDADRLVLEVTIAIQTSLLDTHPTLDLVAATQNLHSGSRCRRGLANHIVHVGRNWCGDLVRATRQSLHE